MLTEEDRFQRAAELAYRYIGRRERTEFELRRHLEQRGVAGDVAELALRTLVEQGYVDDARFARLFTQDKRALEQWGNERIARALQERGIDRELIDEALACEGSEPELERALALLRRRFPSPPQTRLERDRALGVMVRKGYGLELALEAIALYARAC